MTYGEQVAWCARVLDNPDAAREALEGVKEFINDFDDAYEDNKPLTDKAKEFYAAMISSYFLEFGYDKRSE